MTLYMESSRIDFQSKRLTNIVKYWLKIITSNDNKLTKLAYKTKLNDIIIYPHKDNWASSVKLLLSRLGFFEVWLAQGVGNITNFLTVFKIRVKDIFYTGLALKTREFIESVVLLNICKF